MEVPCVLLTKDSSINIGGHELTYAYHFSFWMMIEDWMRKKYLPNFIQWVSHTLGVGRLSFERPLAYATEEV